MQSNKTNVDWTNTSDTSKESILSSLKDKSDEMMKAKFKLGNVEFTINKLNGYDGYEMLEKLRVQLSKQADSISIVEGSNDFARIIALLPIEFVSKIREKLFENVIYHIDGDGSQPYKLDSTRLRSVFNKLEPVHVYELLARCLFVNFFSSFELLISRISQ